jgi:tetratricopeptide repeat protein
MTRTRERPWLRAALSVLAAALWLAGCPKGSDSTTPPAEREPETLSEPLLIALAQAKNYHHQAEIRLADGDTEGAIAAVSRILTIPFPAGAPEGEETRLDARARLAKLYLGAGRLDEARRAVDEGLAAPGRDSFFLANLHTVSGEVHEAEARQLEPRDPAAARAARQAALAAYDRSIQINERLQQKLDKEARP